MNPNLIRGKKVVGSEGYILGEMNDIHVDYRNWEATAFSVMLSGEATTELNLKKPFLRKVIVYLPTDLIDAVGDVITLNAPLRSIKDIAEKEIQFEGERVEGKKVINPKGETVGTVEGADVEVDDWKVTGLQVALTEWAADDLGFRQPVTSKVVVVIPGSVVESISNFVTLDKSVKDLKSFIECIRSCQLK